MLMSCEGQTNRDNLRTLIKMKARFNLKAYMHACMIARL
jgi:hypothetical protein